MGDLDIISLDHNFMTEVLFKDNSGGWIYSSLIEQINIFGGFCIGTFLRGNQSAGTGFIFKVLSDNPNACALILTAAHIFATNFHYTKETLQFLLGSELFLAEPLKNEINWDNENAFLEDLISKNKVSYPEDWVVCKLIKNFGNVYTQNLVELTLADNDFRVNINLDVSVYGYPKALDPSFVEYVAPEAKNSDFETIKNILHGGNKLICASGNVLTNGNLISATCITANGMSGSPLIYSYENKHVVIGMLLGGPASCFHYYIAKILNCPSLQNKTIFINFLMNNFDLRTNWLFKKLKAEIERSLMPGFTYFDEKMFIGSLQNAYMMSIFYEASRGRFIGYNNFLSIQTIHCDLMQEIRNLSP